MTEPDARRKLADRAAEIFEAGGSSYTEAVDAALAEQNPAADPGTAEELLYALLNVNKPVVRPNRRSPRAGPPRDDL